MDSTASTETPAKMSNAERLAALEESRAKTEAELARVGELENTVAQVRSANDALHALVDAQRALIDELTSRVQGLDQIVKNQDAFMDELEKDMKEAFKNNGRTVAGWLEQKDREIAELRGGGSMEQRLAEVEQLVKRLQYRVATR
jgi:DNA-binding ferritin-like protein